MARMEADKLVELWTTYHEAIANSRRDPYRYGFVLPHWEIAERLLRKHRTLLLLGANRSGKTSLGAKTVVRTAVENEGALIYCFSQNQETSVVVQQAAVYEYLPEELKRKATEETHYISYSMQNGFAGNSLVLPNKARIMFKTYSQFQQNQSILEGMELGARNAKWINVGAWCDEYLQGMEMLDRLYLRLATRNAKLMLTFTPKDGVTETVKYYIDGAETVESRPAELLQGRMVPYVQENAAKNTGIVYFHSKDNPWSGYDSIVEQCMAKNDDAYTLTAAYGVPTKSYTSKFPRFSREVNVVKQEAIPTKDVTRYMIIDPAGGKNWFMVWVAVDASDTWWVYREWPDVSYGNWGRYAGGKWVQGDGARTLGYGMRDYVDLIARLEGDDGGLPFLRLIDPRKGATRYQGENGQSSIIEDLSDHGVVCHAAPGLDIEDGLQALQTKLAYNPKLPIDGINRPHFYISERCENLIHAMQEYDATPASEGIKDGIDCLRYAATDGIRYIDPKSMVARSNRRGGY
jgi:hypothetical protein